MAELDNLLADLDLSGTAISQIDDLCGYLRRQTEGICRMGGRWLEAIPALGGDRFRYRIRVWRESAEHWVHPRDIVDSASDSPDLSRFRETAQSLINSRPVTQIIEHPGTKYCPGWCRFHASQKP